MNYAQLFHQLSENHPNGWSLIHYVNGPRGGIYLWPQKKRHYREPNGAIQDSRLKDYSILFEFHVTENNYARILARARLNPRRRWNAWLNAALNICHGTPVQNRRAVITKSVALLRDCTFNAIEFNSRPAVVAPIIRRFLANPSQDLRCFIRHL